MMAYLTIFTLIVFSLYQATTGEVYSIKATSADLCDVPCLTLSQFIANTKINHSDITMIFLPGTHYLDVDFSPTYLRNLTMTSNSTDVARIVCIGRSHMTFRRFQNVDIANLEFIGCARNHIQDIERFELLNTIFKHGGTALELIDTMDARILNSTFISNLVTGVAPRGVLFFLGSKVEIEASTFHNNTSDGVSFGGVILSYGSTVTVTMSEFDQSSASFGGAIFIASGNLKIEACTFRNNSAKTHGAVLHASHSNVTIAESEFDGNYASYGAHYFYSSNVTIRSSHYINNRATYGAGLYSRETDIRIDFSHFASNNATDEGGGLYSLDSNVMIKRTKFIGNRAIFSLGNGAALHSHRSNITLEATRIENNTAASIGGVYSTLSNIIMEACVMSNNMGGAIYSSGGYIISIRASQFYKNVGTRSGRVIDLRSHGSISIDACDFIENSAGNGGALFCVSRNISITRSKFNKNTATQKGGALYFYDSNVRMGDCKFTNNTSSTGSVIYATNSSMVIQHGSLLVANNTAMNDATMYFITSNFLSKNSTMLFSHNIGSLMAFKSNVTFTSGNVLFISNQPQIGIQEGGAMTLFLSNAFFYGSCKLEHNYAETGGAILSIESKIIVSSDVSIAHNKATESGGGVYLLNSELNLQKNANFVIFNNTGVHRGGGLHAISSSIESTSAYSDSRYTGARLNFTRNTAKLGGGMSLEANARVNVLKNDKIYQISRVDTNSIIFTANQANYGGGLYVDDTTYSGICTYSSRRYCFLQVLAMYNTMSDIYLHEYLKMQTISFSQNYANQLGSSVYGGLLDRCAVSQFAEVQLNVDYTTNQSGINYSNFKLISNISDTSVSSLPINVCLCSNERINCTHNHHVEVKKGETFTVSVVAVDQIGQVVNGTIQTSLNFTESGLAEGQLTRDISAQCTDMMFNVVSPHSSEQLILYASNGPCKDAELSTRKIEIHFLPCSCPIGFQVSRMNDTNCTCECHSDIKQYAEHCDSYSGSFTKTSQSRAWIFHINNTERSRITGFVIYSNCPYDYCHTFPLLINLNEPNGADAHCDFNRSSTLCGSCQPGLSLSLGSSLCLSCPDYWPALLIAVTIAGFLAGIAMVVFLLALNMTVAIGTLNGLIFYANILYANKTLLLQHQGINFMSVFVSWLNLDLGIDTCYFPGMDTYVKTWLQLVFPTYIFLLVASLSHPD